LTTNHLCSVSAADIVWPGLPCGVVCHIQALLQNNAHHMRCSQKFMMFLGCCERIQVNKGGLMQYTTYSGRSLCCLSMYKHSSNERKVSTSCTVCRARDMQLLRPYCQLSDRAWRTHATQTKVTAALHSSAGSELEASCGRTEYSTRRFDTEIGFFWRRSNTQSMHFLFLAIQNQSLPWSKFQFWMLQVEGLLTFPAGSGDMLARFLLDNTAEMDSC